MDLINLTYDTLKILKVPVMWQIRPKDFPGISFHFFNEQGILFGDGEEVEGMVSCQIDIWAKGDYTQLKKEVKSAMKKAGFLYMPSPLDSYEDNVKLYHGILRFNLYYESEE